jgi:hypothetical protein
MPATMFRERARLKHETGHRRLSVVRHNVAALC